MPHENHHATPCAQVRTVPVSCSSTRAVASSQPDAGPLVPTLRAGMTASPGAKPTIERLLEQMRTALDT